MIEISPNEPKALSAKFTIRGLMIATAIIAVLLTFWNFWLIVWGVVLSPIVSTVVARSLWKRDDQLLAGICFWSLALTTNGLYVWVCRVPFGNPGIYLIMLWFVILMPSLVAFGAAWANPANSVGRSRSRSIIGRSVAAALVLMPFLTALTLWPFQLDFLNTKPKLDRIADQVAAGKAPAFPIAVDRIEIFGAIYDPATGNVILNTDRGINSPNGFIRRGRGSCSSGPISTHRISLGPGGEWCYHEYET